MAAADRNETASKVIEIVAQKLNRDTSLLTESMSFQELGADSLDMVEIVMRIEEVYGIEVNDEDAEKLHTLGDAIEYVQALRSR